MALFKLWEYEQNQYHDSYGHLTFYNSDTDTIEHAVHWSTAFAGGLDMSQFQMPTLEVINRVYAILKKQIYKARRKELLYGHWKYPKDLKRGDAVVCKVTKPRGKHACRKGEKGKVFWVGAVAWTTVPQVGVELESGRKIFTDFLSVARWGKLEPRSETLDYAERMSKGMGFIRKEKSWFHEALKDMQKP
jgi:hypothetical protein